MHHAPCRVLVTPTAFPLWMRAGVDLGQRGGHLRGHVGGGVAGVNRLRHRCAALPQLGPHHGQYSNVWRVGGGGGRGCRKHPTLAQVITMWTAAFGDAQKVPLEVGFLLAADWAFARIMAVTNTATDVAVCKIVDASMQGADDEVQASTRDLLSATRNRWSSTPHLDLHLAQAAIDAANSTGAVKEAALTPPAATGKLPSVSGGGAGDAELPSDPFRHRDSYQGVVANPLRTIPEGRHRDGADVAGAVAIHVLPPVAACRHMRVDLSSAGSVSAGTLARPPSPSGRHDAAIVPHPPPPRVPPPPPLPPPSVGSAVSRLTGADGGVIEMPTLTPASPRDGPPSARTPKPRPSPALLAQIRGGLAAHVGSGGGGGGGPTSATPPTTSPALKAMSVLGMGLGSDELPPLASGGAGEPALGQTGLEAAWPRAIVRRLSRGANPVTS